MKFIDMHCDTISSIYLDRMGGEVKKLRENNGHVDLARLKKGGCLAQNFALFYYTERRSGSLRFRERRLHTVQGGTRGK